MGIYDNSGKSQNEVIRFIDRNKGSISKVIQSLVEMGLVERHTSEDDRRQVLLTLTEKGEKETERIHEQYSNHIVKVISVLDEMKQQELYEYLDKLLDIALEIEEKSP